MQNRCAIAVMAKAPIPGSSKTRLVPPLRFDQAAALSGAFLSDITANIMLAAEQQPIDAWIAYAPSGTETGITPWAAPGTRLLLADGDLPMAPEVQGLGRSLVHAATALFARGYSALCLVNSDSPTLPTAILRRAASLLLNNPRRVMLGPAEDGGYYLIGMAQPHTKLFADITWSSPEVADQTRARAAALRLTLTEFTPWFDVDDAASLHRLAAEINTPPRGPDSPYAAPATASCLRHLGLT